MTLTRRKGLRPGRSTTTPTREEAAYIEACKSGPCVACVIWGERPDAPPGYWVMPGGDFHHLLSGGRRRGHRFGVCLCGWHHRHLLDWGHSYTDMRDYYGPSLMDGSKVFRAAFGDDETLLAKQAEILKQGGV